MKGTDGSFLPVGFSRTGIKRLKNWNGKCEGPSEGSQRVKELEWECEGPGEGINGLKNRSG